MRIRGFYTVLRLALGLTAAAVGADADPTLDKISVGASSSLRDSGFLAYVTPLARSGAAVAVEWKAAVPSDVIRMARGCGVDAIIVDSPDEEDQLMREGVGAMKFRVMMSAVAERGGAQDQYSVIVLNPGACHTVRFDPALRLLKWLTSKEGQEAVARFSPRGVALYKPNAGSETCTACEARY